jgi:hypothetical protein
LYILQFNFKTDNALSGATPAAGPPPSQDKGQTFAKPKTAVVSSQKKLLSGVIVKKKECKVETKAVENVVKTSDKPAAGLGLLASYGSGSDDSD